MTALLKQRMTLTEFFAWTDAREGKFELVHGEIFAMSREAIQHARAKAAVWIALREAIKRAGLPCEAIIDGPGVTVRDDCYYVPDVTVSCGERLAGNVSIVTDPVIVVEVASPSTEAYDATDKLIDYFLLPSLQHYLIIGLKRRVAVHHRRGEHGQPFSTAILRDGQIRLDPPGIEIALAGLFGDS